MSVFRDLVKKCIAANRANHGPVKSAHEGLALIQEEVHELMQEVYRRERKGDPLRLLNELVEIAAMCECVGEDVVGRLNEDVAAPPQ